MRAATIITAASLCALLSAPSSAAAASPETITALRDTAYVTARTALQQAGSAAKLPSDSWQQSFASAVTAAYQADDPAIEQLRRLRGVDPAHYQLRRKPKPSVLHDLRSAHFDAALLIDRLLGGADDNLGAQLSASEWRALQHDLITAIGESDQPFAGPFLAAFYGAQQQRGLLDRATRSVLLAALARSATAEAVAVVEAAANDQSSDTRSDALIAAARLLDARGYGIIEAALTQQSDKALHATALHALVQWSAPWARTGSAGAAQQACQQAAPWFEQALSDDRYAALFDTAIDGLVLCGTGQPLLTKIAQDSTASLPLRRAAAKALKLLRLARR